MDELVEYNGEKVSLPTLCEQLDIDIDCVRVYIKNGFSPEESVNILLDIKKFDDVYESSISRYKRYEYKGETSAISRFCAKYGLDPVRMTNYVAESDSFEEAVEKYQEDLRIAAEKDSVELNGTSASVHEFAEELGIKYPGLYRNKVRTGKDYSVLLQEELDFDELLQKHIDIDDFHGSIKELIERFDLDKTTILRRYAPHNNKYGMDIITIVTGSYYLKKVEDKVIVVCGVRGNYKNICKKLNISIDRINRRFYTADVSVMESDPLSILKSAIEHEQRHLSIVDSIYELNGVNGTVKELCDHFDMVYRNVVNVIYRTGAPIHQILQDEYEWSVLLKKKYSLPGFKGTLKECIEFLGVPSTRVKKRIQAGETPQKVLNSIYDSL